MGITSGKYCTMYYSQAFNIHVGPIIIKKYLNSKILYFLLFNSRLNCNIQLTIIFVQIRVQGFILIWYPLHLQWQRYRTQKLGSCVNL